MKINDSQEKLYFIFLVSEYLLNFLLQDFFEQEKISQELLNKACLTLVSSFK